MKINNRLKRICDYIDDNSNIIDVGCDHALLDIYLVQNNKTISCIASDVNDGPLQKAKENISKYNLIKKIKIKQGYGIDTLENKTDTIIISGMGGATIIDILTNGYDKLKNIKKIVISPNNDFFTVRKGINKLGYIIDKEEIYKEKNKFYLIASFVKGNKIYSKKEMLCGINIVKNSNYFDYYESLKQDKLYKLNKIPRKYIFKRIKLKLEIYLLKKYNHVK